MNCPAASQELVQPLEVINEVTKELSGEEEEMDQADLLQSAEEIIQDYPELFQ